MKRTIGFIGAGNMATAILTGILSNGLAKGEDILLYDIDHSKLSVLEKDLGCRVARSNAEVVNESDVVFLAVKPQYFAGVAEEIRDSVRENQVLVSIIAGWLNARLHEALGEKARVLRVLPNTPLLVGKGMSCLCGEHDATQDEFDYIESIFKGMGRTMTLDEKDIAAFSGIAGSGPAYVYIFIEAMADAACKCGLPRNLAYEMAAQACVGAGEMVLHTKKHPGELKDAVCSPAGATIEAVHALEQGGFRAAVIDAIERCTEKFNRLG